MSVSSDGTLTRKSKRANVFVLTCSTCLPNFIFLHQTAKFFINFMNFLTFLKGAVKPFGPALLRNQWNMLNGHKTDFSAKFHEFWRMLKTSKLCKWGQNNNNSFNYNKSSHRFGSRALIRNQGNWECLCQFCKKANKENHCFRSWVMLTGTLSPDSPESLASQSILFSCTQRCLIHPWVCYSHFIQTHHQVGVLFKLIADGHITAWSSE